MEEHQAVRERVGLFDVSHLGHLEVSGPQALSQLQPLVTQDLRPLPLGRARYSPMLNPRGGILDEMIIYRLDEGTFRLVVNAANGDKIVHWMSENGIHVEDLREKVGTLALQGPKALAALGKVSSDDFSRLARYGFQEGVVLGRKMFVARTGYTGEDGFELFVERGSLEEVWKTLLERGQSFGIQPVGLGARDTLRLEAGMPLGGNDLDETITPLEAGLEWTVSWNKGPFIGKEVLERQKKEGLTRRLIGFELTGPGVPRTGYPIFKEGASVGRVTSGTFSPTLHHSIGMGYVPPGASAPGTPLTIQIHEREVGARVVPLPFYRRKTS